MKYQRFWTALRNEREKYLTFYNFWYTFVTSFPHMAAITREEFTEKVQEYIQRINQIAQEQWFSVMMAYFISGGEKDNAPDDFIIDWRNMSLNDNMYAIARWNQDIMNNFDDEGAVDRWSPNPPDFRDLPNTPHS